MLKRKATTMGQAKRTSQRRRTPEKKADAAFSLYIRLSRGRCEDDRPHVCRGRLECAHGHERGIRATRYDERNVWALCQGAHFYYGLHSLQWDEFMRRHQRSEYESIRALALSVARHTDYEAIYAKYAVRAKQLKEAA